MILVGTLHFAISFKSIMVLIKCSFATIPINTFPVIYIVCFPCTCRSRLRFKNHMGVTKGERSSTFSICITCTGVIRPLRGLENRVMCGYVIHGIPLPCMHSV